jgi:predicted transposase YbfD/YdcC
MESLRAELAGVEDPRQGWKVRYKLVDIVVMAVCGVLTGAEGWVEIAEWAAAHRAWLRERLGMELEAGVPSHDTFGRVFSLVPAASLQAVVSGWLANLAPLHRREVVAIDGKQVRRSYDRWHEQPALQVVNAWATEVGVCLGQVRVEDDSNEITAVPQLLDQLALKGCIVSLDALHTQLDTAAKIVERGADYLLALKDNHPLLAAQVRDLFAFADEIGFEQVAHTYAETVSKGHGRVETRRCWVVTQPDFLSALTRHDQWTNLAAIVRLQSTRRLVNHSTTHDRFFLTSCHDSASHLLSAIRAHWQIENALHWCLDVIFREDDSRLRCGHAAQNFAILRRLALSWLRQSATSGSLQTKRLRAAWNPDLLLPLFAP